MSPVKKGFVHVLVSFRPDQIVFFDREAERRGVPRVQVIRDAADHYRISLRDSSTDAPVQPTEGK